MNVKRQIIPARFRKRCARKRLPVDEFARFTLSAVADSDLLEEIAKEFKFFVASQKAR
jgi:hypothetical protein